MRVVRRILPIIAAAAAMTCTSGNESTAPSALTLALLPTQATTLQGTSFSFQTTVIRSGSFSGTVTVELIGAPAGVTFTVLTTPTTGSVIRGSITINVGDDVTPGTYPLVVRSTGTDGPQTSVQFALTVTERPRPCQLGGLCAQWAFMANASSEYTADQWGAVQATGEPNVPGCADDVRAWATVGSGDVGWIELFYATAVRPTFIEIYQNWAPGSIVSVEVKEVSGNYHTVYTANAGRDQCPRILAIAVTGFSELVSGVRINLDQRVIRDWNEIDAVKLTGYRPLP